MKIVCLGDSLTYGFGARRSRVWTKIAQDKLGMEIINEGVCGDTTNGMMARFHNAVSAKSPEAVLIMGGVNDFIVGADFGAVKSNIMSMTHQSVAKYIDPIIGIPTKIDALSVRKDWALFSDFNKVAEELEQYQKWIRDFCKTFNFKFIDFYNEFEKEAGVEAKGLYVDGLHFNDKGNEILADIFCKAINSFKK
ncbi:MAG: GDSL-type esterase/lipase family protein [Sedimentibacter sp.]